MNTGTDHPSGDWPDTLGPALRRWFLRPPRVHGDIDEERTVGFLELFYDLVFVVLIGQIAHALAADPSWRGLRDFAIVFGLVWVAWVNGSLYHELHAREDGRARAYIFVQMLLLVVLAVEAGQAAGDDGAAFAVTYVLLLAVLTYQWWVVRRHDSPEWHATTARYLVGMAVTMIAIGSSAAIDAAGPRLAIWAGVVVAWIVGGIIQFSVPVGGGLGVIATESMSERFGLLNIIVLGEVVVGVVDGLSDVDGGAREVTTGLLALVVGFGFWWNYFDAAGRRIPRRVPSVTARWIYLHLPIAAAVAATGAGMVGLIEHAGDRRTPPGTAWLIGGGTAVLLASLAALVRTLAPVARALMPPPNALTWLFLAGSVAALVAAAARPTPWALGLVLALVQAAIWLAAFAIGVGHRRTPSAA